MDPTLIAVGLGGLIIGFALGRRSSRGLRRQVVWTETRARRLTSNESDTEPDEQIELLVRAGKKIHAIKRHRDLYGSDLREAKDAIDALEYRLLGRPAE
jgi:hypothetical protein